LSSRLRKVACHAGRIITIVALTTATAVPAATVPATSVRGCAPTASRGASLINHGGRSAGARHMATYIVLGQFTDQGIRNIKDTTKRAEAVKALGKKVGASVQAIYWTLGQYDVALIVEAPDDASVHTLLLGIGAAGNVRTQSLRAFTAAEMGALLGKMA